MKITLLSPQTFDIKYLIADFGVRYWEDSEINNVEDDPNNPKMPCILDQYGYKRWVLKINIDTGNIINWPIGNSAKIHYKVCDDGHYTLLDNNENQLAEFESYVPNVFAIDDQGYGDYVIMTINEEGFIENWSCCPEDITNMLDGAFTN